jgi:hypothetical protein
MQPHIDPPCSGDERGGHRSVVSRRLASELCEWITLVIMEGAGKAGYRLTPAVRVQQKSTRQNHRLSQYPAFPAQWFDGLYVVVPGVPGLLATVAVDRLHKLSASVGAPGPHDFAVRIELFVGAIRSRCNSIRPPHPALYVRDDREPPLL